MPREKHKWQTPRGESTEAKHWDGPTRNSDEGSVTGPEQRGWIGWPHHRSTGNGRKRCVQQSEAALAASFA